jgi:hypothetical protein
VGSYFLGLKQKKKSKENEIKPTRFRNTGRKSMIRERSQNIRIFRYFFLSLSQVHQLLKILNFQAQDLKLFKITAPLCRLEISWYFVLVDWTQGREYVKKTEFFCFKNYLRRSAASLHSDLAAGKTGVWHSFSCTTPSPNQPDALEHAP